MPEFNYIARTKAGLVQKDTFTAANEAGVVEYLHGQGLVPVRIRPVRAGLSVRGLLDSLRRVSLLDKITFMKNLGVMIKAGLPVSRCLRILSTQTPNPRFRQIIGDIGRMVENGTSLADSMTKHPSVFSPIFVNMVRVGEASGNLEQDLRYLAEQMQRDYDLLSKARGALTYPIIVMFALAAVGFLMFTFVLPKLTSTFKDLNVELPFMTRVVIGLVDVFANYGLWILAAVILLGIGFVYWRTTTAGKRILHKIVLYLPVVSGIVIKLNLARFTRVFASLIKSGMPIVESLEVSSHVVGNIYYQQTISESADKVKIGSPLSATFKKQPRLFSNLVVQMMEVGEESGTTDAVLTEVADFYEAEVDQTMKNLSSILEPVIMIFIGSAVGFLAVALISPIYNITQSIN